MERTLYFWRNSLDRGALISFLLTLEGAEKWAFRFFLLEEVTLLFSFILKADHEFEAGVKERIWPEGGSINAISVIMETPRPLTINIAALKQYSNSHSNMESRWQVGDILCRFLLTLTLLTITVSNAFHLSDIKNTIQHIPLTRESPDRGFRFLRGADFHFDKEIQELNHFRARRNAEDSVRVHNRTKITEEFELTGDNHTVAFLHWSGKKSPVSFAIEVDKSGAHAFCFVIIILSLLFLACLFVKNTL